MFTNIFNTVVEKLSGLNPIKTFIKYALDKFLNQLINNQITLEDFKNGSLNLKGIGFNVSNVNLKHLISSPYIMHCGSIGNLRIQLPNLSQVVTKSIQIEVSDIFIELKPNKDFYKNFKQRMKQLQENMVFDYEESLPQEQLSENNPMDFFKETLKKILLNIRVKVQNITVKIYMNDPEIKRDHQIFYLIFRIPLINVHKNNDHKKKNLNVEEIKLDIQIPQISLHVVKQNISQKKTKENQKEKTQQKQIKEKDAQTNRQNKDKYPSIQDSSTIFLLGLSQFQKLQIETDKSIPRFTLSVVTNNKQERRDIKVSLTGARFQMMLDPLQLRVLDRFIRQVREFKEIFEYVKGQLNLGQYNNHDIPCNRRANGSSRFFQSHSEDIFSSICMSILEPDPFVKSKKPPSIIDSMIKQTPDLQRSVSLFNQQFKKQLREKNVFEKVSQEISSELRVANFQKHLEMSFQIKSACLYILKQVPGQNFVRKWVQEGTKQFPKVGINKQIPCSYFVLIVQNLSVEIKENSKLIKIELSNARLNDVKLVRKPQNKKSRLSFISVSDQFMDLQSSCEFYNQNSKPNQNDENSQPTLFLLGQNEHFCATEILRLSQKPSQTYSQNQCFFYNFMPKSTNLQQSQSIVYRPSLIVTINKQKSTPSVKIEIIEISININFLILKQFLDIVYEVYRKNSLKNGTMNWHAQTKDKIYQKEDKIWKKKGMLQSRYNFGTQSVMVEHAIEEKSQPSIQIKLYQINLAVYQSLKNPCFCNSNIHGLYLEIFSPKIQLKNQVLNLSFKKVVTGSIEVRNSHVTKIKAFLNISSLKGRQSTSYFNFVMEKDHANQLNKIYIVVPECSLNMNEEDILSSVQLLSKQMKQAHELYEYFIELKEIIQRQQLKSCMSPLKKKQRKPNQIKYEPEVELNVSNLFIHALKIKILTKQIYLKISPSDLVLKFLTLVIALDQKLQLFLNQMKNQQLCLREHIQKWQKYHEFCKDSNIILEISEKDQYDTNKNQKSYNQSFKKNEKFEFKSRHSYFKLVSSKNYSVTFTVTKSSVCDKSSLNTNKNRQTILNSKDKFKFSKKPSHRQSQSFCGSQSIIIEQEQQKKVTVSFSQPVYLIANSLFRLNQQKEDILQFVKKLAFQFESIKEMPFTTPSRKFSTDSQIDKLQSLSIFIETGRLYVDIRPTFKEDILQQKSNRQGNKFPQVKNREIIFSSSRSFLDLGWQMIEIQVEKRVSSLKAKGSCGLKYYFLEHEDREIATNPILIRQNQLLRLGFIPLLELSALRFDVKSNPSFKTLNLNITSLTFQSSLLTLGYLQLHWQHFIKHNVNRNYGLTVRQQEQRFQPLEVDRNDSDEFIKIEQKMLNQINEEIQDLTEGLEYYRKKTEFRKQLQEYFLQKSFTEIKPNQQTKIFLEQLSIKELKIKIYSGSDFEFISLESINESHENKRNRINDSEILKYLQLRLDLLSVVTKVNDLQKITFQSIMKIQNFEINYSSKRQMKNTWLGQKKMEQVIFPVLKSLSSIKILLQFGSEKLCIKLNKTPFDIGFKSQILQLVQEYNTCKLKIQKSGWKKIYQKIIHDSNGKMKENQKTEQKSKQKMNKLLLVYIPENRLNLRLIYKNINILSDQSLISSSFLLNEEIDNQQKIQAFIKNWVKNLVFQNIGGLIGGTAINVLSDVIMEMLGLGYFIVSLITGS